jgi:hypothetical protein
MHVYIFHFHEFNHSRLKFNLLKINILTALFHHFKNIEDIMNIMNIMKFV